MRVDSAGLLGVEQRRRKGAAVLAAQLELFVAAPDGVGAFVAEARRLQHQILGIHPDRQREFTETLLEIFADIEAELTGAPAKHLEHCPLDALTT